MSIKHLLKDFLGFQTCWPPCIILTLLWKNGEISSRCLKKVSCTHLSPGSVLYYWWFSVITHSLCGGGMWGRLSTLVVLEHVITFWRCPVNPQSTHCHIFCVLMSLSSLLYCSDSCVVPLNCPSTCMFFGCLSGNVDQLPSSYSQYREIRWFTW